MNRRVNDAGRQIVKEFESLRFRAYPDPGMGGAPWTIGCGHTAGIKQGDSCSMTQAERWLGADLSVAEQAIEEVVEVVLTDDQFSALVSFVFNVGADNFRRSTLLRMLNAGDFSGAADQLLRWNKAAGKVLPGLTRRRTAERSLFLKG